MTSPQTRMRDLLGRLLARSAGRPYTTTAALIVGWSALVGVLVAATGERPDGPTTALLLMVTGSAAAMFLDERKERRK